jgi:cytochrome P450
MSSKCPHFDIMNPDTYGKGVPFETYKELRASCPVSPQRDTVYDVDCWAVTKREDLDFISKNPALFSSEAKLAIVEELDEGTTELLRNQIINMDPPKHIKHRRIIRNAFTSRAVDNLEPRFRQVAKEIVDRIAARGECEFVEEVAAEMPLIAICELIGIPIEERSTFFHLVNVLLAADDAEMADGMEVRQEASFKVFEYAMNLAVEHRANPKPGSIIGALLDGTVDGEFLSEEEFCYFFLILVVGGIETTRTVTSQGMRLLMEHPEQLQMLVDNPEMIPEAVEEILRYNSAFIHMRRTVMEDIELGGQKMKKGDKVLLCYHSVNHDEDVFGDDADLFDITRSRRTGVDIGKEHRAFGIGQHFCLGTHLARKELICMFDEIISRMRNPKLAAPIRYLRSNFISGIKEMKISFDPEVA